MTVAILLPGSAHAFWFFTPSADAAAISTPDSSTPVLRAATNIDPNPDKGLADTVSTGDGTALVAYAGPTGTMTDIAESTSADQISIYVVRSGDSLSDIAKMFNVSVNTIVWANNLKNTRDVHTGDTLIILPVSGVKRTIAKGDTLKSLAKKYNADAKEIAQYNGLDPQSPLIVGDEIIIPGGEVASVAPAATSKTRSSVGSRKVIYEPYLGGSGAVYAGYYTNPVPNGIITQTIHGWNAVDLGASRGTPIHAAADGVAIIARNNGAWNGGYGNYVVIRHDNGSQTLYSHMVNAIVSSGQSVSMGQTIGYLGSTGLSTGPHLHFEVRGAANPLRNCTLGAVCGAE